MDRYLVGAVVQYSYSLFVLLQGGDLRQEKKKYGKWGHYSWEERNILSNASQKEDKFAFSFIHSFILHSLIYHVIS